MKTFFQCISKTLIESVGIKPLDTLHVIETFLVIWYISPYTCLVWVYSWVGGYLLCGLIRLCASVDWVTGPSTCGVIGDDVIA